MTHGLTLTESADSTVSASPASMSIIGLVATSMAGPDDVAAEIDAAFPLNTPVLVTSVDAAAGNAGSLGTLKKALEAIGDQSSPIVVVVRVAEGETVAETDANVIGSTNGSSYTGLQALLAAESLLGVRPRIIGAPGLDTQAVATELVISAKKLRGFAYARAIGADVTAAVTYRDHFSSRELMLLWPDTNDWTGDAVARALGLRARIDQEIGWHKTISNVAMDGVLSITKDVHFDLLDASTDAGVLNDAPVTTIIQSDGYRFWGNRTTAGDDQPDFAFETATRTSYALQDVIASTIKPFIDHPIAVAQVKNFLEKINTAFRALVRDGKVVGAECFFDKDANTSAQLASGKPKFRIRFTPCAPMENPTIDLQITDFYYSDFADQLV
ncbi:phage tail sheath subtilisin-like domain-containing protein [Novosphingobium guangzhouense]|uniref:Phage tail protein n=1 Tax=Novosphingobium guangzhouense TaxID=1850347 RepID=A0A2K2G603_9SPHN|nr:phage tail sheath subtilisin-like domain-containing protein [Novosphingobium guangzhouense]PNU06466.1 phage tail protein [Novosphingobium guangzhouense]